LTALKAFFAIDQHCGYHAFAVFAKSAHHFTMDIYNLSFPLIFFQLDWAELVRIKTQIVPV
jgi:hypothetical protein